jgi:hypothetical protein
LLKEVPLFALLDDQERAELARQLDVVHFDEGQTVFNYGDPGDAIYVISSGARSTVENWYGWGDGGFEVRVRRRWIRRMALPGIVQILRGGPKEIYVKVSKRER